jgi:hypothetical protein
VAAEEFSTDLTDRIRAGDRPLPTGFRPELADHLEELGDLVGLYPHCAGRGSGDPWRSPARQPAARPGRAVLDGRLELAGPRSALAGLGGAAAAGTPGRHRHRPGGGEQFAHRGRAGRRPGLPRRRDRRLHARPTSTRSSPGLHAGTPPAPAPYAWAFLDWLAVRRGWWS